MPFDWLDYIKIADDLILQSNKSPFKTACLRSSVSRAYYCVYCTARDFVVQSGISIPKGDSHTFVIDKFKTSSGRVTKKVGEDLGRLHGKRRQVDYDASIAIDYDFAKTALNQAINIYKLFSDPNVKIDGKNYS